MTDTLVKGDLVDVLNNDYVVEEEVHLRWFKQCFWEIGRGKLYKFGRWPYKIFSGPQFLTHPRPVTFEQYQIINIIYRYIKLK